uniref:Uncharacterized protein n=1 Tax=Romanomermis culicivorax TaxID=13658 RepID=A0A915HLG3_ROMCU
MGVIGPMAPMGGMPPPQMMPPYGLPMRMPLPPALMRGGAPNFQRPFVGPSYPPSNESTGVISSGPVLSAPPAVVKYVDLYEQMCKKHFEEENFQFL